MDLAKVTSYDRAMFKDTKLFSVTHSSRFTLISVSRYCYSPVAVYRSRLKGIAFIILRKYQPFLSWWDWLVEADDVFGFKTGYSHSIGILTQRVCLYMMLTFTACLLIRELTAVKHWVVHTLSKHWNIFMWSVLRTWVIMYSMSFQFTV